MLSFTDNVALHCGIKLLPGRAWLECQVGVQRIKPEEITMCFTGRWTGPVIAGLSEIIAPLQCSALQPRTPRHIFGQKVGSSRDIPDDPVDPGARRRVRIVDDERKAAGLWGVLNPSEQRRDIWSLASIGFGNLSSGRECRA